MVMSLGVMTERIQSQLQASEMRFLRKNEGVTLFNKVRSSENPKIFKHRAATSISESKDLSLDGLAM